MKRWLESVSHHPYYLPLLFGIVLASIRLYPALFGKVLYFGDNFSLHVPGKMYTAQWLRQGILPLWNPTILGGIPWVSEINQSVLYPTTILFTLFSPSAALTTSVFAHLVITSIGSYFLGKKLHLSSIQSLLLSILWTYSSHMTASLNNLSIIQSISWFPWIMQLSLSVTESKTSIKWYSLFILLMFLGGYPQHVVLAVIGGVLLSFIHRQPHISPDRWITRWLICGFVTLIITAVAWLPFLQDLLSSSRVVQSASQSQSGVLQPLMMIKAVFPYFFDLPILGIRWGAAWNGEVFGFFYAGIFGIILLFAGYTQRRSLPQNFVYGLIIIVLVLLSLGENLPFYGWLQRALPVFKWGRYPGMMMILANMFIAILISRFYTHVRISKRIIYLSAGVLSTIFVGGVVVLILFQTNPATYWSALDNIFGGRLTTSPFHTLERDRIIFSVIGVEMIIVALSGVLGIFMYSKKRFIWVLFVILIDLFIHTQGQLFFQDHTIYSPASDFVSRAVGEDLWDGRVLTRNFNEPYTDFAMYWDSMLVRAPFSDSFVDANELSNSQVLKVLKDGATPNWNMTTNMPTIHGYTALMPLTFSRLWQSSEDESRINFLPRIDPTSNLAKKWAVKYYIVDEQFDLYDEEFSYPLVGTKDTLSIYKIENSLSRFRYLNDDAVTLNTFSESPNEIQFTFSNPGYPTLIIADRYDKDWQAWVNGVATSITNYHEMRGVPISDGENNIRLRYVPRLFYISAFISFVGILTLWSPILIKKNSLHAIGKKMMKKMYKIPL